jgi:hypothetical protein
VLGYANAIASSAQNATTQTRPLEQGDQADLQGEGELQRPLEFQEQLFYLFNKLQNFVIYKYYICLYIYISMIILNNLSFMCQY